MEKKYILFGAGEYGIRALKAIDSTKVLCFCDNGKAGTEVEGKKVISVRELKQLQKDYIVAITVEKKDLLVEIWKQLEHENIPFIFASELLLENHIADASAYPLPIRLLMDAYGVDRFIALNDDEKREYELLERKYKKFNVCLLPTGNISVFCYSFAMFCKRIAKGNDSAAFCCIGYYDNPASVSVRGGSATTYIVPNEFLLGKFSEKFQMLSKDNINFWCLFFGHHFFQIDFWGYEELRKENIAYGKRYLQSLTHSVFLKPTISLSMKENKTGHEIALRMGIKENYICFFARDNAYLKKTRIHLSERFYAQQSAYRNSEVNQFQFMAKKLDDIGIGSVRMGSVVESCYHGKGIDYPNWGRSDFMDAYLFANCMFYIGDGSGLISFPKCIFGKPVIVITPPLALLFKGDLVTPIDLLLFRKMYYKERARPLSLREVLELNARMDYDVGKTVEYYFDLGIYALSATPEEIWDVAKEMLDILAGKAKYTEEDIDLRKRYFQILREYIDRDNQLIMDSGYPSASWLRDNQWFLE